MTTSIVQCLEHRESSPTWPEVLVMSPEGTAKGGHCGKTVKKMQLKPEFNKKGEKIRKIMFSEEQRV